TKRSPVRTAPLVAVAVAVASAVVAAAAVAALAAAVGAAAGTRTVASLGPVVMATGPFLLPRCEAAARARPGASSLRRPAVA
ncbi:MAG TPA: hypothetical protein VNT75_08210, partial [Symbiobacteriaceae bacterium]|nr:hypothetical protein [Symbiobacteriaceae bacterium]